jgi:replicative DNA helicase
MNGATTVPVSAEGLLISALVNTRSVGAEVQYGISSADFEGYQDEYNWLVSYVETYDDQPTRDIFLVKFPGFFMSEHTGVQSAAEMVYTASNRRRITTAISEAVDLMHVGETDAAHQRLVDAKPKHALPPPRPVLSGGAYFDALDRPYCVEVPYPSLQRYTGGIRAGNLWYVAARPTQGKSAHLVSMSKHAIKTGNRVLFYSLEMSEEEMVGRFHAAFATELGYSTITVDSLRARSVDLEIYRKFIGELDERMTEWGGDLHVHTPADGLVSPSAVASRCGEYQLTVIDYITLMQANNGAGAFTDWRVVTEISNSLKVIALAQKTGIVCAAQINRDGETGSAPPKVKNLAQSDALGQDGDVVLTMRAKPKNVATHFSLEKNRHGTSGVPFYTTFDPNRGVFAEISADHAEDLAINAEEMVNNPSPPKLRVIKSKDEL